MDLISWSLILIAVFFVFLAARKKQGYPNGPKSGLPPGPKGWPVVGNLLQLSSLPHKDFAAFSAAFGPLVYLRLGGVDAVTTDDPDVIREILVRQDDVFASRPRTCAAVHLAYNCGDVALAPLGPRWKRMRRICMEHLLTTRRLDSFAGHRAEEAGHLVVEVRRRAAAGVAVDLREVLAAFSMNNVTRMLLGKQLYGGEEEAVEFREITHEMFHLLGMIYLGDYLPAWRWIDPFGCERKMKVLEKRIDDFHSRTIEEHRRRASEMVGKENGDEREMDFVDVLLSLPGEDGRNRLDDVEIKALIQVGNIGFRSIIVIISIFVMLLVFVHRLYYHDNLLFSHHYHLHLTHHRNHHLTIICSSMLPAPYHHYSIIVVIISVHK